MDINKLPRNPKGGKALNDLVFTDINDSPDNLRFGLGYHQLYDPAAKVGLIAMLPDVTRDGDKITLYWDGAKVQEYFLDQTTIDKGWLSFGVSPILILDPQGEVYYTLYDHDSEDLQTSTTRTIAVNRRPPGGLDPNTDTSINEGLALCTVSPNPVTNPAIAVTVNVPQWTYQEVDDELTVMWNNIRVDHPKLKTFGPQTVAIPREVLEQGGSSEKLLVNYEIRDIVDNYSLVSPPTFVLVEIDPNALTAPRVPEADRITRVLDLEALGDNDAHVAIPSYTGNHNGYEVTLSWVGKTQTADISLTLPPIRVDDPDFDHAQFSIPNAHMKQIAGGSAVTRYSLVQDGDASPKPSKTSTITITGLPVELAPPVVDEANGSDVIDLADITGLAVTVSILAYTGQSPGDKVLLNWKGTPPPPGAPVNYTADYEIKTGEELLPVTFTVARENLDPLGDGKLDLSYQVIFIGSGSAKPSRVASYSVTAAAVVPANGDEGFELKALGALVSGVRLPFDDGLFLTITGGGGQTAIIDPLINQFGNRALYCAPNHTIKFEFGGTINTFLISHAITATALNRLEFFGSNGLVKTYNLKAVGSEQTVQEVIPLESPCVYCQLTVDNNGTLVDNLVWE